MRKRIMKIVMGLWGVIVLISLSPESCSAVVPIKNYYYIQSVTTPADSSALPSVNFNTEMQPSQFGPYKELVKQLTHPDPNKRVQAIKKLTEAILNEIKEESLRTILSLEIGKRIDDEIWEVRIEATWSLGRIIPTLKDEIVKINLANAVNKQLNRPDGGERRVALLAFKEIIPSLKDETVKIELTKAVAKELENPRGEKQTAVYVLGFVIPSLKDGKIKIELAIAVGNYLESVRDVTAVYSLGKIIPALEDDVIKTQLTKIIAKQLGQWSWGLSDAVIKTLATLMPFLNDVGKNEVANLVAIFLEHNDIGVRHDASEALAKIIPVLTDEKIKVKLARLVGVKLEDLDAFIRDGAVTALGDIIPSLKDESVKIELARAVAGRLKDPYYLDYVRKSAAIALGKIIPSLKDEAVKEELARALTVLLGSSEAYLDNEAVAATRSLGIIIPILKNEAIKIELTTTILKHIDEYSYGHTIGRVLIIIDIPYIGYVEITDVFKQIVNSLKDESKVEIAKEIAKWHVYVFVQKAKGYLLKYIIEVLYKNGRPDLAKQVEDLLKGK